MDAVAELEGLLPRQILAAKEVLTNPNDPTKRQNVEKLSEDYKVMSNADSTWANPVYVGTFGST